MLQDPLDSLIHHYSSWWKLKRAFAWLFHYKQFIQSKVCKKKEDSALNDAFPSGKTALRIGNLMVVDLQRAVEEIIRWVQKSAFPDVYKPLANVLPGSVNDMSRGS